MSTTPPPTTGTVVVTDVDTPVGPLRVASHDGVVVAAAFADHFERMAAPVRERLSHLEWVPGPSAAGDVVARYVGGEVTALDELEVDVPGTPFRTRVWDVLRRIPVGETWSYAELAEAVGSPDAVRAVGSANGANPVWLVVPCHRVVRSDGSLGGYGGGLDRKAWLLAHEGARLA